MSFCHFSKDNNMFHATFQSRNIEEQEDNPLVDYLPTSRQGREDVANRHGLCSSGIRRDTSVVQRRTFGKPRRQHRVECVARTSRIDGFRRRRGDHLTRRSDPATTRTKGRHDLSRE